MKQFRLDPCLKIRRHREECEEIRLGELIQDRRDLQASVKAVDRSGQEARAELSEKAEMMAAEALLYQYYFASLDLKQMELTRRCEELDGKVDQQRKKLIEARKDLKVIEKLKDRFLAQRERELDRLAQLELEDLFLQGKVGRRDR